MAFRERGRQGWGVGSRGRETVIGCLLYVPWPQIKPAMRVCSMTRNWTHNLLVFGMRLQATKPRCQGSHTILLFSTAFITMVCIMYLLMHLFIVCLPSGKCSLHVGGDHLLFTGFSLWPSFCLAGGEHSVSVSSQWMNTCSCKFRWNSANDFYPWGAGLSSNNRILITFPFFSMVFDLVQFSTRSWVLVLHILLGNNPFSLNLQNNFNRVRHSSLL